jgi:hypothetical protein
VIDSLQIYADISEEGFEDTKGTIRSDKKKGQKTYNCVYWINNTMFL